MEGGVAVTALEVDVKAAGEAVAAAVAAGVDAALVVRAREVVEAAVAAQSRRDDAAAVLDAAVA
eukprot:1164550-Prymnesium_polylepis.1